MDLSGALGFGDRELAAFVGAGGKKTAMARLAEEGRRRGFDVGYTTTTHTPPPDDYPLVLAEPDALPEAVDDADSPIAFARRRVENPDRVDEKVRGYNPAVVDECFRQGDFDWLLVKADGARRREFKAPGPAEPVLPAASTRVVPVASARAVSEPLGAPTVHRPERVADVTGLDVGDEITPAAVGAVLASEVGGLKGVPEAAAATPLVNKADTPALAASARAAVEAALDRTDRFDRGLVTSFETGRLDVVRR